MFKYFYLKLEEDDFEAIYRGNFYRIARNNM